MHPALHSPALPGDGRSMQGSVLVNHGTAPNYSSIQHNYLAQTILAKDAWSSGVRGERSIRWFISPGITMSVRGVVKAWIEARGMGFVTSATQPDEDYFVHRSSLVDCQYLVPGSQVTFDPDYDVTKDSKTARNVSSPDGAGATMGGSPVPAAGPGQENGVVKAWLEEKGMGFITPADGTEDRFVHRSSLLSALQLSVGLTVSYNPDFDMEKGKPAAKNVVVLQPGPVPGKGGYFGGKGYDNGKGSGYVPMGKGDCGKRSFYGKAPPVPMYAANRVGPYGFVSAPRVPPGHAAGVVKAWLEHRGMGFIVPNIGGDDLFVHRSQILNAETLREGSPVTYEPSYDVWKDKAIAKNVSLVGPGQAARASRAVFAPTWAAQPQPQPVWPPQPVYAPQRGGVIAGIVKSWIKEKGLGGGMGDYIN